MIYTITTRYKTHPNSNVGDVQARLRPGGMVRTVRMDAALDTKDNHRAAADKLAKAAGVSIQGEGSAMDNGGYTFEALS